MCLLNMSTWNVPGSTATMLPQIVEVWWSDLLVLHNYCVIISEFQKVTFLVVEANKIKTLDKYGRVAAAH